MLGLKVYGLSGFLISVKYQILCFKNCFFLEENVQIGIFTLLRPVCFQFLTKPIFYGSKRNVKIKNQMSRLILKIFSLDLTFKSFYPFNKVFLEWKLHLICMVFKCLEQNNLFLSHAKEV